MINKKTNNLFRFETIVGSGVFSLLANCFVFAQPYNNKNGKPEIEVYVSSQAGDRLTKKKNATFIPEANSSLPVITEDKRKLFQTIEGFGATFNEAGLICLNSLSLADQNRLLKFLFDSVRGAGFTIMKSP